jgi:hypothetical protein
MSTQTLACGAGYQWTTSTTCQSGQLCDSSAGSTHGTCLPVITECADHGPGDQVCIVGALRACGPDLVSSSLVDACGTADGACARCKPVTLISGRTVPGSIAVDEMSVYWLEGGSGTGAFSTTLDGSGAATPLGTTSILNSAWSVAVDMTNLYAVSAMRTPADAGSGAAITPIAVPLQGGTATPLDSSGAGAESTYGVLAIDDASVYWSAPGYSGGAILKVAKSGGASTMLASGQGTVYAIAVDAMNVYWTTNSGTVAAAPVDSAGGSMHVLASQLTAPRGIAVMNGAVYWNNAGAGVGTIPSDGGNVTMLASGPGLGGNGGNFAPGIAVDASAVYWADSANGKIMKVPRGGGTPVTVATAYSPLGLAIDTTYVYWAAGDGTIMKIAK